MRGIVFEGNGEMKVETVPDPAIQDPGDAIVRVTMAGICGSDLHIYTTARASASTTAAGSATSSSGSSRRWGPT